MPTNGGEEHVLGENTPLALALSKALGSAIVSESDTRSDCIKSSFINNKCILYSRSRRGSMQELEAFRRPPARFREGTAGARAGYYGDSTR